MKNKKQTTMKRGRSALVGLALILGACGGSAAGTDAASDTRTVSGNLGTDAALLVSAEAQALTDDGCAADTVIATATDGTSASAAVDSACDFSLALTIGKSYSIGFVLGDVFVASLVFEAGADGSTSSDLPISSGTTDLDLGIITITGNIAVATSNPLSQCDKDDDGDSDYDDSDDDNDGIDDSEERDCDLDGSIDDNDESDDSDDDSCSDSIDESAIAPVISVKPRNDPNTDDGEDDVDLDKDVKAKIKCLVDETTLTADTFRVVDAEGNAISCSYDIELESASYEIDQIRCRHDADPFTADMTYTITLDGLMCLDGRPVESRSWQFHTESSDDDDGDAEDSYEDDHSGEDETGDDHGDDDDSDDDSDDEDSDDDSDTGSDTDTDE